MCTCVFISEDIEQILVDQEERRGEDVLTDTKSTIWGLSRGSATTVPAFTAVNGCDGLIG